MPTSKVVAKSCDSLAIDGGSETSPNPACSAVSPPSVRSDDCDAVEKVITVDKAGNETMLTNALNSLYSCWSRTIKAGFAVYKRQIEIYIWDSITVTCHLPRNAR